MKTAQGSKNKKIRFGWLVKLAEMALNHPLRTLSVSGVLIAFGLLSWFFLLPREGFPPVNTPIIWNQVFAAGLDADEIDSAVILPLDQAIRKDVSGIKQVDSTSFAGGGSIVVTLEDSIDTDTALSGVQNVADTLNLPPTIRFSSTVIDAAKYEGQYDMLLAVTDGDADIATLERYAKGAAEQLMMTAGVEGADVIQQTSQLADGRVVQIGFAKYGRLEPGSKVATPKSASLIGVKAATNVDTFDLSDSVAAFIGDYEMPNGVELTIAADFAPQIESQIDSLLNNLGGGLLAVVLLTLFIIAVRASFVTALFITSVLAVTVGILWAIGFTINTISLFALVLALGLFVDDATIVVEAAERANRSKEKGRIDKLAVRRIAMASFAGTMTTVLVFLPLAFISGILGGFIRVMPITIIVALIVSLLLSVMFMPIFFKYVFNRDTKRWFVARKLSAAIDWLAGVLAKQYHNLGKRNIRGYIVAIAAIGFSFVVIGLGVMKFKQLTFNIFPNPKDSNSIIMNQDFAVGVELNEAIAISNGIDDIVLDELGNNVVDLLYYQGNQRSATAQINLIDHSARDISSVDMIAELEETTAPLHNVKTKFDSGGPGPVSDDYPFRVQIYSEDEAVSLALANDLVQHLKGREIIRSSGKTAIITDSKIVSAGMVERRNGDRYVEVGASFDANDTSALVVATQRDIEDEFNDEKLSNYGLTSDSVEYDFGFESDSQKSFSSLLIIGPISLIVMYLLLAFQFRSLLQPLLIFLAIPFSLFGIAYGLSLTDNSMSFFSMVGFLGLIGIAVNNTIMLVDYANQEKNKGLSGVEAISNATRLRLRPLLTTTLTTAFALLPLAVSDPFWQPLAVTIIFGLLSSTVLIIIAFPYFYLGTYWLRGKVMSKKQ